MCAMHNTFTAESYQFTPVSDLNSVANYKNSYIYMVYVRLVSLPFILIPFSFSGD